MNLNHLLSTIDAHVEGEAFRIITQSPFSLVGKNLTTMQQVLESSFYDVKELLLNEPRGHRAMNGIIVLPSQKADYSILLMNHSNESFRYGAFVASLTALLETGNLKENKDGVYRIETLHGIFTVNATMANGEVSSVCLENQSAQMIEKSSNYVQVEIDGGRRYFVCDLPDSIGELRLENLPAIQKWGRETVSSLEDNRSIFHGVILKESLSTPASFRSVTFEPNGNILRSPGIDSTFALLQALTIELGDLQLLTNYSIYGSSFTAKKMELDSCFSIESKGFITGIHEFLFDQSDPFKKGFLLG